MCFLFVFLQKYIYYSSHSTLPGGILHRSIYLFIKQFLIYSIFLKRSINTFTRASFSRKYTL